MLLLLEIACVAYGRVWTFVAKGRHFLEEYYFLLLVFWLEILMTDKYIYFIETMLHTQFTLNMYSENLGMIKPWRLYKTIKLLIHISFTIRRKTVTVFSLISVGVLPSGLFPLISRQTSIIKYDVLCVFISKHQCKDK